MWLSHWALAFTLPKETDMNHILCLDCFLIFKEGHPCNPQHEGCRTLTISEVNKVMWLPGSLWNPQGAGEQYLQGCHLTSEELHPPPPENLEKSLSSLQKHAYPYKNVVNFRVLTNPMVIERRYLNETPRSSSGQVWLPARLHHPHLRDELVFPAICLEFCHNCTWLEHLRRRQRI